MHYILCLEDLAVYSTASLSLVQIYENGRMSQYVKEWQVGSVADWRGPFGGFMYIPNKVYIAQLHVLLA